MVSVQVLYQKLRRMNEIGTNRNERMNEESDHCTKEKRGERGDKILRGKKTSQKRGFFSWIRKETKRKRQEVT